LFFKILGMINSLCFEISVTRARYQMCPIFGRKEWWPEGQAMLTSKQAFAGSLYYQRQAEWGA